MKLRLFIYFLLFSTINICFPQNSNETQLKIDSLTQVINSSNTADTSSIKARTSFGELTRLFRISYWDSIATDCQKILDNNPNLAVKKSILTSQGSALNNMGFIYIYLDNGAGNVTKGLEYLLKSLKVKEEIGNKKGIAASLNNVGNIYENQGDISKGLDYYHKSLKIREEIDDKKGIANSLNNIATIFESQGDIQKALAYHLKSLSIREKLKNQEDIAHSFNNIGAIYAKNGDPSCKDDTEMCKQLGIKKGLTYYNKGLKIYEEIGYKKGIASILSSIAEIGFLKINKTTINTNKLAIDRVLHDFQKSLSIYEEIKEQKGIASALCGIAKVELSQNKTENAKTNAQQALSIAQTIGYPKYIKQSAKLLSEIYEKENKGMKALAMHKLYIAMRDSIDNKETLKASTQLHAQYQYEKQKALDDAANDKLIAIAAEKEHKQEIISYATSAGLILVIGFLIFVFNRLKVAKKRKTLIEAQKLEVERQKSEVEKQRDIAENQKLKIAKQHSLLEDTHQEISDSINYAQRLQLAILPSFEEMNKYLPNSFIFYQPKNVVSGDFYWMECVPADNQKEETALSKSFSDNKIIFMAVGDCTGHGVPGAMVSVVCSNALNRSIYEYNIKSPSKILDKTRDLVIETFTKSGDDVKDGMDIALLGIELNEKSSKLKYAGANNPLWIIRKTNQLTSLQKEARSTLLGDEFSLISYKATNQPIGSYISMRNFEEIEIEIYQEDTFYIFSDGYVDQFGGEKSKKFLTKSFKKLLLKTAHLSMKDQKNKIKTQFEDWKGNLDQIDDVCVLGFRVAEFSHTSPSTLGEH